MLPGYWQGGVFRPHPVLTLQTLRDGRRGVFAFPGKACAVDVSGVEDIDSIGIAALVNVYRQAHKQGVALEIVGAGDRIRRLLALYGLPFPC